MEETKKDVRNVDNQSFVDRWQFVLSVNDNIICQRYFKILGFDHDSLESAEFLDVMNECVNDIKTDLESKSRIYMWYTNDYEPIKLCGFRPELTGEDVSLLTPKVPGVVTLSTGEVVEKTYLDVDAECKALYEQRQRSGEAEQERPKYVDERPEHGEVIFKFAFLFDSKVYYERIWDGNVYPKYVRNTVDLSNSDIQYRNREPSTLPFAQAIVRHLTIGRKDLIYHMIRKICDVCSNPPKVNGEPVQKKEYVRKMDYGTDEHGREVVYMYSTYNQPYYKGWRKALAEETRAYEKWANNHFSDREIAYIDRKY